MTTEVKLNANNNKMKFWILRLISKLQLNKKNCNLINEHVYMYLNIKKYNIIYRKKDYYIYI
jgi:hypothetical protein